MWTGDQRTPSYIIIQTRKSGFTPTQTHMRPYMEAHAEPPNERECGWYRESRESIYFIRGRSRILFWGQQFYLLGPIIRFLFLNLRFNTWNGCFLELIARIIEYSTLIKASWMYLLWLSKYVPGGVIIAHPSLYLLYYFGLINIQMKM